MVVVAVGTWAVVAAVASSRAVTAAEHRGTAPLTVLTHARILAQQARADDELTLVTRDSDQSYQKDYSTTSSSLAALLQTSGHDWTTDESEDLSAAAGAWAAYGQAHHSIRSLDQGGQLLNAISGDQSSVAPAAGPRRHPLSAERARPGTRSIATTGPHRTISPGSPWDLWC